jgi:hypothetical protein
MSALRRRILFSMIAIGFSVSAFAQPKADAGSGRRKRSNNRVHVNKRRRQRANEGREAEFRLNGRPRFQRLN